MKKHNWILTALAVAVLTSVAVSGTFGNDSGEGDKLCIVQSVMERDADGLREIPNNPDDPNTRKLLPAVNETITKESVTLKDSFPVIDNSITVSVDFSAEMYTVKNALDHIVVVTNAGNIPGYIRTWFAFEMGDLTKEEFEASVCLNRNTEAWNWGEFQYGVEIGGKRYAVVYATYDGSLASGATTAPSLLQILLDHTVSNETAERLDGNGDGKYEIKALSRAVSAEGAWGSATLPAPWADETADKS